MRITSKEIVFSFTHDSAFYREINWIHTIFFDG